MILCGLLVPWGCLGVSREPAGQCPHEFRGRTSSAPLRRRGGTRLGCLKRCPQKRRRARRRRRAGWPGRRQSRAQTCCSSPSPSGGRGTPRARGGGGTPRRGSPPPCICSRRRSGGRPGCRPHPARAPAAPPSAPAQAAGAQGRRQPRTPVPLRERLHDRSRRSPARIVGTSRRRPARWRPGAPLLPGQAWLLAFRASLTSACQWCSLGWP
mmetsp:Transcript_35620/g.90949  ORF Transcript_35620/g.90949 Transcript_35620/m.90949 type:complete len:211 (-) Transcript_35620:106-738(-)